MDDWKLKSRCVVKLEPTPNMFISPFVHVWLISTNSQRQLMLSICRVITEFYQPLTSLNRVALIAESVESAPYLSNFKQTNCRKIAFTEQVITPNITLLTLDVVFSARFRLR